LAASSDEIEGGEAQAISGIGERFHNFEVIERR
jgi:hypothetical protein